MRSIGLVVIISLLVVSSSALQCKTRVGATMLLYRLCANDFQCARRSQITPSNTLAGTTLDNIDARLHNEGYQILNNTSNFLSLVKALGVNGINSEADFVIATQDDDNIRESDIFHALWTTSVAAQLPRIFFSNATSSDAIDCEALAISTTALPPRVAGEYVVTLYAINTYRVEIAMPPECNNINEDRILDFSTGEYYCSCRPGKTCAESTHLLPFRVTLLVVIAVAAVVMLLFITWKGGNAFYSVDKLEAFEVSRQTTIYSSNRDI